MITRRDGLAFLAQASGLALASNAALGVPSNARERRPSPARTVPTQWNWADQYLDKARVDWRVPGLSVAIVRDGALVYAKGFGFANVEARTPVTADTMFATASTTKAFTATGVAMLVDQGKLDWDAQMGTYLPGFQMGQGNEYASVNLGDMLSHRTGLARHDLLWYNNKDLTLEGLLTRLPHLPTFAPLRARYQYSNLTVMLAGLVIERVTGLSWEAFTKANILEPLGMARSNLSLADMGRDGNHANGHRLRDDKSQFSIPLRPEDRIGPAGGLNSTVNDYAKWMLLHLGRGTLAGKQLFSPAQSDKMQEPMILSGGGSTASQLSRGFYGLGWRIDTYRGITRVAHGGNLNGFASRVSLFPEKNLGLVAFTNLGASPLAGHVTLDLVDHLLGLEPLNTSTRALERRNAAEGRPPSNTGPKPIGATTPSRLLPAFAGHFNHKGYGDIFVTHGPTGLRASYNDMPMGLDHWHYDVFNATADRGEDSDLNGIKFEFNSDVKGQIDSVAANMDEDVPAIVFKRV